MIRSPLAAAVLLGLGSAARADELDKEFGPRPAAPAAVATPSGTELDRESPQSAHRWRGGWGWGGGWGRPVVWGGGWGGGWNSWGWGGGFSRSYVSVSGFGPSAFGGFGYWPYPAFGNVYYGGPAWVGGGFSGFGPSFGYGSFYGGGFGFPW